jgi:hypothetical protein
VYAPVNFTTKGTVKVGGFVWRDTTDASKVAAAGTGAPLGFMERVQNFANYDVNVEGTLAIPENSEVNVAIQGDFYVVADAAVTIGATVYADTTTGAVTFTRAMIPLIADLRLSRQAQAVTWLLSRNDKDGE